METFVETDRKETVGESFTGIRTEFKENRTNCIGMVSLADMVLMSYRFN